MDIYFKLINLDDMTLIPLPISLLYFPGNSLFIGVLIGHSKGWLRKNHVPFPLPSPCHSLLSASLFDFSTAASGNKERKEGMI